MITEVRTALETLGYRVHQTRQEKIGTNELVVVLEDVDIEIETTLTYHANCWILIEWDTMAPDNIPTQIVTLVSNLEEAILDSSVDRKATFKFRQSEVNQLGGLMYRVSIIIEYVEEINLD